MLRRSHSDSLFLQQLKNLKFVSAAGVQDTPGSMSVQLALLHTVLRRTAAALSAFLSAELAAAAAAAAAEPPPQPMVAPYIQGRPGFCSAAVVEPSALPPAPARCCSEAAPNH